MSIDYVSKNLGCEGEEQKRIFRQEGVRKGSRSRGKRCGGAERCWRDGETDGTGSLKKWEKMALEYTWRDLFGRVNTPSISLGKGPRPLSVLWQKWETPKRQGLDLLLQGQG